MAEMKSLIYQLVDWTSGGSLNIAASNEQMNPPHNPNPEIFSPMAFFRDETPNQQHEKLHFLVVPLMSQSHLIPMTDFAKLLAKHGLKVTIITTPLNAARFKPIIDQAVSSNLEIQLVSLQFPCLEAGLPEGCENLDSLTSPDLVKQFFKASGMLQQPLEDLVANLKPPPSCIITSNALPWTSNISAKFQIPRYVFHAISCFTLLCSHNMSLTNIHDTRDSGVETVLVPDVPHRIEFTKSQLPEFMNRNSDNFNNTGLLDQMKVARDSERGVLVNSFEEMEPAYAEGYKKVTKRTWCIGPVSLCNKEMKEKLHRGNKNSVQGDYCFNWLDSKDTSSVIYACFGSLCHISYHQLVEIGLGLEASNSPFIWIIRGSDCSEEIQNWLEKEKFQERNKGKGLVIQGWAPQVLILSHPAVGGFLTHCGWNSTLEGVCAGVPMITWPMFAEQFYNEKLVTEVLRIGVKIGVEVGMIWGDEQKNNGILVDREQVKKAIGSLIDEGEEMRNRARELAKMADTAIEEGGSSYSNIALLIQDVVHYNKSSAKIQPV